MLIAFPPSDRASRVTLAIQLSWYRVISRVSSMLTTLATGGINRDTAFSEVVFPDAVPPMKEQALVVLDGKPEIDQGIGIERPVLHRARPGRRVLPGIYGW